MATPIELIDFAGKDQSWTKESFDGYILMYDITAKASFEECTLIHDKISRLRDDSLSFPAALVGNKLDAVDTDGRQVEAREAEEQARQWDCTFREVSAKTGANVQSVIEKFPFTAS